SSSRTTSTPCVARAACTRSSSSPTPRAGRSGPPCAHPGSSGGSRRPSGEPLEKTGLLEWGGGHIARLAGVWTPLALAIIVGAVCLGLWCLVSGARGRFLNQPQYSGLLLLALLALVQ